MSNSLLERNHLIYQEMMVHPVLFSHQNPTKIAILAENAEGMLTEVLKHEMIDAIWHISSKNSTLVHAKINPIIGDEQSLFAKIENEFFDILIVAQETSLNNLKEYFRMLAPEGILLQQGVSPFDITEIKTLQQNLLAAGFVDNQLLHFPQPNFESGWRAAFLAKKQNAFLRIREKDIFNKSFATSYYNYDVHKAALVMPEFIRHELI